jgi:hypothetical protein
LSGPELPAADNDASLLFASRTGDDAGAHEEIPGEIAPAEGTVEENLGENAGQENAAGLVPGQEGVVGQAEVIEEVLTEGDAQKLESTTPRIGTNPETRFGQQVRDALDRFRLPKIRGPFRLDSRDAKPSSPAQPGNGTETPKGEQDSAPAAASGEAA